MLIVAEHQTVHICLVLSPIRLSAAETDSDTGLTDDAVVVVVVVVVVVIVAAALPPSCHKSARRARPVQIAGNIKRIKRCARKVSQEVVSMRARLCRARR